MTQGKIEIHEGVKAMCLALDNSWDQLVKNGGRATWFQLSGWYNGWVEAVAGPSAAYPVIIRIEDSSGLRAGLALQLLHNPLDGPIRLTPLSMPWADYHEALGSPNDDFAIERLAESCNFLAEKYKAAVAFEDVMANGLLSKVGVKLGLKFKENSPTFTIRLDRDETWRKEMEREEFRRKRRRLARLGTVTCHHHTDPEIVARRLPVFFEMHQTQWKNRPGPIEPFDDPVVVKGFKAFSRYLTLIEAVVLTEFCLNDQPIAMYYGFKLGLRYGGYRTTFDLSFRRYSPGHLMLHRMLEDFQAAGLVELDLMRGSHDYKLLYISDYRKNLVFHTRPTMGGR